MIRAGAEVGAIGDTAEIGTMARIVDFYSLADGLLGITCIGEQKFRVLKRWQQSDGLNLGDVELRPEQGSVEVPGEFLHLSDLLRKVLPELGDLYASVPKKFNDAAWVGYRVAEILPVALSEKQQCLELDDAVERLQRLNPLIKRDEES